MITLGLQETLHSRVVPVFFHKIGKEAVETAAAAAKIGWQQLVLFSKDLSSGRTGPGDFIDQFLRIP